MSNAVIIEDYLDLQFACQTPPPCSKETLEAWIKAPLIAHQKQAELTVRFVEKDEITQLNETYRKKTGPTNVLAFPSCLPAEIKLDYPLLGDVIVCPEVLAKESKEQNIPLEAHWAHIVMHGVLHLLGYDHIEEAETRQMQAIEIKLLAQFGFANPYQQEDSRCE